MTDTPKHGHTSVLLHESIDGLEIVAGDIYVDGTLGSGGHAEEVVRRFGDKVRVIGIDMDADALTRSQERLSSLSEHTNLTFVQGNFRNIKTILENLKIEKVNRILLDIGLSSNQLETSGRGFSFMKDEPLQMTFAKDVQEDDTTAETVVNEWSEETLITIIRGFGEERYAKRIAHAIVVARDLHMLKTTKDLVDIIGEAVPAAYKRGKLHYATRTFQAIRIAVNQELQSLKEGLEQGFEVLAPGSRMAVISFHSLEDRIVKNFFRDLAHQEQGILITKKPITATDQELDQNRRSRSAKLRIIQKI